MGKFTVLCCLYFLSTIDAKSLPCNFGDISCNWKATDNGTKWEISKTNTSVNGHFLKLSYYPYNQQLVSQTSQMKTPIITEARTDYVAISFNYLLTTFSKFPNLKIGIFLPHSETSNNYWIFDSANYQATDNQWKTVQNICTYIPLDLQFQLTFQGDVYPYTSIGIDNIEMQDCSMTRKLNCSFEHDLCAWRNDFYSGLYSPWNISRASPQLPKRYKDSLVLQVEAKKEERQYVRITSPRLIATDFLVLSFWYCSTNAIGNTLEVGLQPAIGSFHIVWKCSDGNCSNEWSQVSLNIRDIAEGIKVVIKAIAKEGVLAVDNTTVITAGDHKDLTVSVISTGEIVLLPFLFIEVGGQFPYITFKKAA